MKLSTVVEIFGRTFRNVCDFGLRTAIRREYNEQMYHITKKNKYRDRYISVVQEYMKKFSSDIIEKYRGYCSSNEASSKNVWVCWWQGEEQMPEWIKMCYVNLKYSIPSEYNLTLITRENYSQYVSLPQDLVEKREKNIIPITQFSDVIRNGLLSQKGGLWLDASIWVNEKYWDIVDWNSQFWSVKLERVHRPEMTGQVVSGCRWASFNMYGKQGNLISSFVFEAMCKFYLYHNQTLDYFGQNHFIRIAYDMIPEAHALIDAIPFNNPCIYSLPDLVYRNAEFDQSEWNKMNSNTGVFKITQKRQYLSEVNGKKTYYGYFQDIYRNYIKKVNS